MPVRLPGIQILEDQERLGVQNAGHGLQLVENNPAQVNVVHRADQQDHVEVPADEGDVVDLGDRPEQFRSSRQECWRTLRVT